MLLFHRLYFINIWVDMIKVIAFDGDDTLWHHENLFADTKDKFTDLISQYTDVEDAREKVSRAQILNLDIFGYGVKGFTLSMVEAAIEMSEGKITAQDTLRLINFGKSMLQHPVVLLDDVRNTIETLYEVGDFRLMIITKGDLFDQESKVARSGIADYFDGIEIVSEKNQATYSRIMEDYNIDPQTFLMVGNSIKSDILPVIQAGGQAIQIPYYTTWEFEKVERGETKNHEFLILEKMKELLPIIDKMKKNPEQPVSKLVSD